MEFAKNAAIDGKMMEIITPKMYGEHKELYANTKTAIEIEEDGVTYCLPYRNTTDDRPGIYDAGDIYFLKLPSPEEAEKYQLDHLDIIDLNNTCGMEDYLNKKQQLRNIENETLTDINTVYSPVIGPRNSPAMAALKTAISKKQMDIDRYAYRFGSNYLNDIRILKGDDISLKKLISFADKFDMEVELVIRDKDNNVPNPMGSEVKSILTGGGENNE